MSKGKDHLRKIVVSSTGVGFTRPRPPVNVPVDPELGRRFVEMMRAKAAAEDCEILGDHTHRDVDGYVLEKSKPITNGMIVSAKRQAWNGKRVDDIAKTMGVDPEKLKAALKGR